jgi:hypothetical protein
MLRMQVFTQKILKRKKRNRNFINKIYLVVWISISARFNPSPQIIKRWT